MSLLLAIAFAAGCGQSASESTRSGSSAIQGGQTDTTHTFAVGLCIGGASNGDCPYICSGALIAPNLVVTARHCVQQVPSPDNVNCATDNFSGSHGTVRVTTASNVFQATQGWHTGLKVETPTQTKICGNDIALVILKDNVPASAATPATPDVQYAMTDHDAFPGAYETAIGYGNTGTNTNDAGVRRILQNVPIVCIPGDSLIDCGDAGGLFTSNEFITGNGTCSGDSGSGSYDQDAFNAGNPTVMGVLSRGGEQGGNCVGGIYSRLDVWKDFIIAGAKEAAGLGGYTVPAWTQPAPAKPVDGGTSDAPMSGSGQLGDTCTSSSACASKLCEAPASGGDRVCTQSCNPSQSSSCPDGYTCAPGDAPNYCFSDNGSGGGGGGSTTTTKSGCAVAAHGGPTHPVPWRGVAVSVAFLGLAFARRRRRRRC